MTPETRAEMRAYAIGRIEEMATRPLMFAATREGYLMQVWLCLEFAGIEHTRLLETASRAFGNSTAGLEADLTDEFSARVITWACNLYTE